MVLSFLASILTKPPKATNQIKEMQILSPERYIILNRDEINSYDEYNLDFLRDMSREDILKKVPHQELLYYKQLFILLDEDLPLNVK